jgi:anaerobic selenocysteine-containing dehydrogenase
MPDQTEDRRAFLKKTATVAWATPLLLTLSAGRAAAQVSCAPAGTPCGVWNGTTCTGVAVICCEDCNPTALEVGSPCECSN